MKIQTSENKFNSILICIIAIVTVYAAVIATVKLFETPRIGFVNTAIMLEKYAGAIEAREKLNTEGDKWQVNIKTLETELSALNDAILKENDKWNKKTRQARQETFRKKQEEYARYKRAITEKAAKLEQELLQTVYDELNAYMEDFGKDSGHKMILGTVSGGNILYAQEATDLTEAFLAYVEERT